MTKITIKLAPPPAIRVKIPTGFGVPVGGVGAGVTDGDKGDVTVSGSGTVWTVDNIVNQIIEVANFAALPGTGALKNLYKTLDNGNYYEWTGSGYAIFTGIGPYYLVPDINAPNGVVGLNENGQIPAIVLKRHDLAATVNAIVFADGEIAYEVDGSGNIQNIRFGDGTTAGGRQIDNYRAKKFTEGIQTIPDLTASVNNWSPAQDGSGIWRLNATTAVDITGIANTAIVSELWNVGTTNNITLKHLSTSSGGINRMRCPGNVDLVLTPGRIAIIRRDSTSLIWRVT